jgi:hypothetical protein
VHGGHVSLILHHEEWRDALVAALASVTKRAPKAA